MCVPTAARWLVSVTSFWQCSDICQMSGGCAFKPFREVFHCASSCHHGSKGKQAARNPFIPAVTLLCMCSSCSGLRAR